MPGCHLCESAAKALDTSNRRCTLILRLSRDVREASETRSADSGWGWA